MQMNQPEPSDSEKPDDDARQDDEPVGPRLKEPPLSPALAFSLRRS